MKYLIQQALEEVKKSDIIKEMLKEYDIDEEELDYIPICFQKDLNVSARTDHGIIYLNEKLINKPKDIPNYLIHEITHWMQQSTGNGPTKGSTADNYLDNEYEIEGFNNQTHYISETKGDHKAEKYVDKLLNHHEIPNDEKAKRKKELLDLAGFDKDSTMIK